MSKEKRLDPSSLSGECRVSWEPKPGKAFQGVRCEHTDEAPPLLKRMYVRRRPPRSASRTSRKMFPQYAVQRRRNRTPGFPLVRMQAQKWPHNATHCRQASQGARASLGAYTREEEKFAFRRKLTMGVFLLFLEIGFQCWYTLSLSLLIKTKTNKQK